LAAANALTPGDDAQRKAVSCPTGLIPDSLDRADS
jgi:hypothetical protein